MITYTHSSTDLIETMRLEIHALGRANAAMSTKLAACSRSHLGILSGAAIRYELGELHTPVDIIAIDWRKLNEWNAILGYNPSNVFLGRAARVDYAGVDRRHATRTIDLRGQWGGDELLFAVDAGCGLGLFSRLLHEVAAMSRELSASQRTAIQARTGGLISGFCVAAVLIENSTDPYHRDGAWQDAGDATRAIDATGVLKSGAVTGARATSGARGSVLGRMVRG